MGLEKIKRSLLAADGFVDDTESITLGSTMQTLSDHGASFVTYGTSGSANDAVIPDPSFAGLHKHITVDNQTTSLEASFHLSATGRSLWSSTSNTITIATTASPTHLSLVGVSTSQWAVVGISAHNSTSTGDPAQDFTFSKTTGSTGQS